MGWRNYWRGNRFGGPISMPPGLQVTMARNQGMMNQGFSQLGNNLRQQFGQIGQFRNPFQRQKSSEPITLGKYCYLLFISTLSLRYYVTLRFNIIALLYHLTCGYH